MDPHQGHDDVAALASSARTNEHRAIASRIVQLQTRITSNRRRLERLQAHASHQDDGAERLQNAIAQHEFEMQYWVARLELLQPIN
jgi:hypothetical protein